MGCGAVLKENFGKRLPRGWKLKIHYNEEKSEVSIVGNRAGLEFLANCCLAIIGRQSLSDHMLLQWQMNNLLEGSTETYLKFSKDEKVYAKI